MTTTEEPSNRIVLSGKVKTPPQTRVTPAGIPITRFTLDHRSIQLEAEHQRKTACRIIVVALGEEFQRVTLDSMITVEGFLSFDSYQQHETRLVIHAQRITEC